MRGFYTATSFCGQWSSTCRDQRYLQLLRFSRKMLNTSCLHVFHESITLPVLQGLDPLCPGLEAIKKLLFNSRRLSTKRLYNAKWARFVHFCTLVQDEAGSHRLQSLPASQATLLAYIGFIAQEGNIRSSSHQFRPHGLWLR